MKHTTILTLLVAALIPAFSSADPVIDDFATIPNLGASIDSNGGLMLANDGNYYGMVGGNGVADAGSLFKMTPAGVVTTLVQFTGNGGAAPGNTPRGRLLETPDGFLYGVTYTGKTTAGSGVTSGTVFKVSKAGAFTSLVTFIQKTTAPQPPETAQTAYGAYPIGDLAMGTDGIIYGTTYRGGINDQGTIWGLNATTGAFATVLQFGLAGANAPVNTFSGLIRGAGNILYGLGFDGGTANGGCVFSFQPGVGYLHLASFNGMLAPNYGNRPAATLTFGTDGKLYGTTTRGGVGTNDGTAFRCSTSGTFEHRADFNANAIARTGVGVTPAPDGNFYGIGLNDRKVFRMTPAGAITTVGVLPTASLAFAPWTVGADGNLYTAAGGHVYRLRFDTPVLTAHELWRQQYFGSPANAGNGADLNDFESDGAINLFEWAFGLNPLVNDAGPIVVTSGVITQLGMPRTLLTNIPNGVDFRVLYGRRKNYVAVGITYTVQFSADNNTWDNSPATPTVIADDGQFEAVTVPYPLILSNGKKAQFFRVAVTAT